MNIITWFRRLFCRHDWKLVGNMWFKCRKCGKEEGLR